MLRIYEGEIYNIELAGIDFATFLEQIEQNPDGKNMIFVSIIKFMN